MRHIWSSRSRQLFRPSNRFGGLMDGALRFLRQGGSGKSQRGLYVVSLGLRLYDLLGRRQRA